jgi:type II secretory pathway pseudopilin PulG
MTVIVVLGLLMTMIAAVFAPMMRAQNRTQAKLDTVQSASSALYRIQRELRQTYYASTWACTTGASASCSQPTTFGSTKAIAFPTAYQNGNGQFQLQSSGSAPHPNWQGVMVYWIDSAGNLGWAFDSAGFVTGSNGLSSTAAALAVVAATTGVVADTKIAVNVQQLAVAIDPSQPNMIWLKMQAQSTENGSVNETTYLSNMLARQ